MLMITPPDAGGWASISSTAFQEASTVPRRSTARSRSSFSVRDRRAASPVRMSAPALFTHTSTCPNVRSSASASASRSPGSATSARIASARRPADRAPSAVSSAPRRFVRYVSATSAPAAAYARAIARPMPLDAPVTSATLPSSDSSAEASTALPGDAASEEALAEAVAAAASLGVAFVKVGFAGVTSEARARRLAVAAQRAATDLGTRLVLVAYADWRRAASLAPASVLAAAADAGAAGVLLDTANKGAHLFTIESPMSVAAWIAAAHAAGLFAALAGGLSGREFARARSLGADIVGVRGAACVGGRTGRVSRTRVAALRALAGAAPPPPPPRVLA